MYISICFVFYKPSSHGEYVRLNESTPPGPTSTHIPRDTGRGGGVAAIYNSALLINPKPKLNYKSFESLILRRSRPGWKTVQFLRQTK